jgi:UDPglucose--hexose-1-phosphate uridylyltransferase
VKVPELRQNIITSDWVVVAPERAKRPKDFVIPKSVTVSDKTKCPFCVDSEGYKKNKSLIKMNTKNTYVIENRFPAFIEDESKKSVRSFYPEEGFYRARASIGDHEVVVIKDHNSPLMKFTKPLMDEVLEVIRSRYIWMKEHEKVASIVPIYNHGAEAGASIDHPHAQIFASGIVTNEISRELEGADKYYGINGACVYCDIINHELKEKGRIVFENEYFIAFNFYAPRFPFETWILPKKHESQFEKTTKTSLEGCASALVEVLQMMDKILENPPLNFFIHTLPTTQENCDSYHWHIEIAPRVSRYGGFELSSDIIINTMPPEEATDYLLKGKAEN